MNGKCYRFKKEESKQLVARAVTDQVSCLKRCFVYFSDKVNAIEIAEGELSEN